MRSGWAAVAAVVVALLVPAVGHADPAAPAPKTAPAAKPASTRTKIAVLDVQATGDVDKKQVQGLSTVVASEVSSHPQLEVVTSSDIRTMLGFQAEKQLLQCGDSHCLAQLGGALGVEYIVAPEATRVGHTYLATVVVLDVARGQALARHTERTESLDGLIDAMTTAVRVVLSHVPALMPKQGAAGTASSAAVSTAPAPAKPGRGWLAWTLTGVGGVLTLLGTVGVIGAWSDYNRYQKAQADPAFHAEISWRDAQGTDTHVGIAYGAIGVGVAAVVGSFLLPHPKAAGLSRVEVAPVPGGAYASLTVTFDP